MVGDRFDAILLRFDLLLHLRRKFLDRGHADLAGLIGWRDRLLAKGFLLDFGLEAFRLIALHWSLLHGLLHHRLRCRSWRARSHGSGLHQFLGGRRLLAVEAENRRLLGTFLWFL